MVSTQPTEPPRKKRKAALVISIIAAVLVVLAGAAAVLFFTLTYPAEGRWYNEERGEMLVFDKDGNVDIITLSGTQSEAFSYSRLKNEGSFSIGEEAYGFEADDQEMLVDNLGTYLKADDGFSVASFLDEHGKLGTWYSEERGEVLVFNTEGALERIRLSGTQDTDYEYEHEDGNGLLTLGNTSYSFSISNEQMDIVDLGGYTPAGSDFDSDAFIDEFGKLGTWYCEDRGEVLAFNMDGTVKTRHLFSSNQAAFEYDREASTVAITMGPYSYEGRIEDDQLVVKDMGTFIQAEDSFDEGAFFEDFGDSVLGVWYDKEGELVIDLHADGTYDAVSYGTSFEGTYTQQENGATITYDFLGIERNEEYSLSSGELVKDDPQVADAADTLTREDVEQLGENTQYDKVIGTWVSSYANVSIIFVDETHVILTAGEELNGTYSYDPLSGIGVIYILGDKEPFVTDGIMMLLADVIFIR
jgi:hypothetical protein